MVDALEIGFSIKEKRLKLGVTQAQLAELAGVSKRCLWSMELGQNSGVQLDKLTSVLDVLGLELEIKDIGGLKAGETECHSDYAMVKRTMGGQSGVTDALSILTGGSR